MVKLQKANKDLAKDRKQWQDRSQSQLDTILRMTEANEAMKYENVNIERQRSALEKLCRQLQIERMACIKKLKELNLSSPMPELVDQASDISPTTQTSENFIENGHFGGSLNVCTQTEFPFVIRRLPLRLPAKASDTRPYIELEEGQLMTFKVDIRHIHDRYMAIIEDVSLSFF